MNDSKTARWLTHPKLRWPLDLNIDRSGSEHLLILRCPLGISPQPLVLKAAVAPLIAKFEGQLSIDQIAEQYASFGIQRELVHQLARLLDEHLFLSSPTYHAADAQIRADFTKSVVRPAALAGLSYSSSPETLRLELDAYLVHASPRGNPPKEADSSPVESPSPDSLYALMSPHIDYQRGGHCYGAAYGNLRGAPHDLFLVMGTAHQYSPHIFHLCRKHFETPLGRIRNDDEFTDYVASRYGESRSFADEFLHRREHSLELQLPFFQHVVTTPQMRFCPILVGSFHRYVTSQRLPDEYEEYASFVEALVEAIRLRRSEGKRVCVIAGVDMAHVGSQFGDNRPIDDLWLKEIEHRDRLYLAALQQRDKRQLFEHIAEDQDQRRICGFPTMYTILDVFDRLRMPLEYHDFGYHQAVQREAGCVVTFAAGGFYSP